MGLNPIEMPRLETETLVLRPFTEEDAGFIYELFSSPETNGYSGVERLISGTRVPSPRQLTDPYLLYTAIVASGFIDGIGLRPLIGGIIVF
jgi:RimJ/RimL family protein N-acetyltransferase